MNPMHETATDRLLVCTDLDRTLIPNGDAPESPDARDWFRRLAHLPEVTLAYVTGRDKTLVEAAIAEYNLPAPDFVLGDVGTSFYHCNVTPWHENSAWLQHINEDWPTHQLADLMALLCTIPGVTAQEATKQTQHKLSFYVDLQVNRRSVLARVQALLQGVGIKANWVWSVDEAVPVGLLDILPPRATKRHAIEFLMHQEGFETYNTVFAGDSGNDLPVLVSTLPTVLVKNAPADVRAEAIALNSECGQSYSLYCAKGGWQGMNGNYAAGILEGVLHYYPHLAQRLAMQGD